MSADESPRLATGANEENDRDDVHLQNTSSAEFVTSAGGNADARARAFEHIFGTLAKREPCREISVTLCGSVRDRLEGIAAVKGMSVVDLAAALIVAGLDGGDRS